MPPVNLPPIALFGYDSSVFTNKIRLSLKLLQIPYTFVLVPTMMPRPILVENFNLTYRKIPVLAIGRELIVDTSLIVEWLHTYPEIVKYRDRQAKAGIGNQGQELHQNAQGRVLSRLLSSHFTDRPLFRLTTGLIPGAVWRSSFGKDRANLIGHKLDPDKLEQKIPRNMVGLDTYLSILEPLFGAVEGEVPWILGGQKPSAADLSLFYQLQWGEQMARGKGIDNLTGYEAADGDGEGIGELFNRDRYPGLLKWFKKFESYVNNLPSQETRVEMGDRKGVDDVMSRLIESAKSETVPMVPTPNSRLENLEERIGLRIGSQVSIAPDDTGRANPTSGKLVALSPEEVVIEPNEFEESAGSRRRARVEGVRLHFPRVGFVTIPSKPSKL